MRFWKKLFGVKEPARTESSKLEATHPTPTGVALGDAFNSAGYSPIELPRSHDELVNSMVQSLMARHSCQEGNTFETGEKNPQSILCSDDACPCTDRSQLVIGRTAYLYISQEVVDFRKECRTLLERNIKLTEMAKRLGSHMVLAGGFTNPFYLCETGARRRGLNLDVAMADAMMVAETGFAPLRPTPKAAAASAK